MEPMVETAIRRLRIHSLKAQIESSRLHAEGLAELFEEAQANAEETEIISAQYDNAQRQVHSLQRLLEILEREEREST